MWSLARTLNVCASHGIDGTEVIEAFGLLNAYSAVVVLAWLGVA